MPTSSGVTGTFSLTVADVVEHAARRCGIMPSDIGPESQSILTENLWMLLSNWSNRGINLWRLYRPLFGLYPGQAEYPMNAGDIEVENAFCRTPTQLTGTVASSAGGTVANLTDQAVATVCTQTSTNGNFSWDFGGVQTVALVGVMSAATRSYNLVFEYSTDGSTWLTATAQGAAAYVDGVWQWLAIEPAYGAQYFRVRETGGATLSLREVFVAANWQDISMAPLNRDDYGNLPNKRFPGTPRQYWFDRQLTPKMVVWPVPSSTFQLLYCITHRHIEDVGALANGLNIPQRWYDAVVWKLAFMSVGELPNADLQRYPMIKDMAMMTQPEAENEDRDKSPITITPDIGAYTR